MNPTKLAVIGGSGLYEMPGLERTQEFFPDTPFGRPSARIITGDLGSQRIAFLARHGLGHRLMPSEVPYQANIFALKMLGVERVISISACGSLRDDFAPGEVVIPDQVYDHTHRRSHTFFSEGLVAHISVADPFCTDLSRQLEKSTEAAGGTVHRGGALITIEGPRFSTRIESNVYRSLGLSLINMTTVPEVFLAREAELCYAVMNHVTDYDVWHVSEAPVSVSMLIDTLNRNTILAQQTIRKLAEALTEERSCECGSALGSAIITNPAAIPAETRQRLLPLVSKYLG